MSLEAAAHLGELVGGISTFAAVLLAGFELTRRRRELQRQKRSDAAARALVALTRASRAVDTWLSAVIEVAANKDPEVDFEDLLRELERTDLVKRETLVGPLRDLDAVTVEAFVHLEPSESRYLTDLHDLADDVRSNIASMVAEAECVPDDYSLSVLRRILDCLREGKSETKQILETGAAVLQPIARFAK